MPANPNGLPEVIKFFAKGQQAFHKVLSRRIQAARDAGLLNEEERLNVKGAYLHEYPEICFCGNIEDVPAIVTAMADSGNGRFWDAFLNIDQGINGFAIGNNKLKFPKL